MPFFFFFSFFCLLFVFEGDGTIDSKAPTYLKELVEKKGWLERLVTSLLRHLRRADGNVDAAAACAYALEAVAINEKVRLRTSLNTKQQAKGVMVGVDQRATQFCEGNPIPNCCCVHCTG